MALNHTNTGADQRKSWARTTALTRTTHGPLKSEYSIRELRDLTRARATAVGDRTREVLRLEKMLESSGITLSGTVASLTGVSSRAMLDALIEGERDPLVLAQYG